MEKIYRTLQFFRVLDEQNNLSLTNIALVAVLGRLLMLPTIDVESLMTFVAAMVGYHVKRVAANISGTATAGDEVEELRKAIDSLKTKTSALELGSQINGRRG